MSRLCVAFECARVSWHTCLTVCARAGACRCVRVSMRVGGVACDNTERCHRRCSNTGNIAQMDRPRPVTRGSPLLVSPPCLASQDVRELLLQSNYQFWHLRQHASAATRTCEWWNSNISATEHWLDDFSDTSQMHAQRAHAATRNSTIINPTTLS